MLFKIELELANYIIDKERSNKSGRKGYPENASKDSANRKFNIIRIVNR